MEKVGVAAAALLASCTIAAAMVPQPLGHRAYTYATNYTETMQRFNQLSAGPTSQISVVNAYGGWFEKSLVALDINCTREATVAPGSPTMTVKNEWEGNVVVKACNAQRCTGPMYHRCAQDIPQASLPSLGMEATLTLDREDVWLLFYYNATFMQECWPPAAGLFPSHLTIPMTDSNACSEGARVSQRAMAPPLNRADAASEQGTVSVQAAPWNNHAKYATQIAPTDKPFASFGDYMNVPGVDEIVAVIDGRMDLCAEFAAYNMTGFDCSAAPDVSNSADEDLDRVTDQIVSLYCPIPYVSGLQIDLEPFGGVYQAGVVKLLSKLSAALRSTEHGCVDSKHPKGRSISFFTFAAGANNTGLLEALGPNGEVIISGYDLFPVDNKFTASSPSQYAANLRREIANTKAVLGGYKFSLGIPVAASTHEYETYTAGQYCGPACSNMTSGYVMNDYVTQAMDILTSDPLFDMSAGDDSQFRGVSFWLFGGPGSVEMYPPHSGNMWGPTRPSPDVLHTLHTQLPKLKYPQSK